MRARSASKTQAFASQSNSWKECPNELGLILKRFGTGFRIKDTRGHPRVYREQKTRGGDETAFAGTRTHGLEHINSEPLAPSYLRTHVNFSSELGIRFVSNDTAAVALRAYAPLQGHAPRRGSPTAPSNCGGVCGGNYNRAGNPEALRCRHAVYSLPGAEGLRARWCGAYLEHMESLSVVIYERCAIQRRLVP